MARDAAEYEISERVLAGELLTEEDELEIVEKYYKRIPHKSREGSTGSRVVQSPYRPVWPSLGRS